MRTEPKSTSLSASPAARGSSMKSPMLQAEAEASSTGKPGRRFKDFRYANSRQLIRFDRVEHFRD